MRARLGARLTLLALLAAGLGAATSATSAAPAVDKTPAKAQGRSPAVRDVTTTATAAAPEEAADDANCTTSRKRLFVEGEGWIVRRVTTCR
jgi:ABC-type amino acid transport substrate-binding protein